MNRYASPSGRELASPSRGWRVAYWALAGLLTIATALSASSSLRAEDDLPTRFLRGLRERNYFDYALLYLDQLAARSNLPAELRQVLPYERAVTLVENSRTVRNPERQLELLDQATTFLEQFSRESPQHPLAADANSQRGTILLNKARVEVQQSRSPANSNRKQEFQQRARKFIAEARQVFVTAAEQHEAVHKTFPTFIDESQNPEQYAARSKSEINKVSAQLNQVLCGYEEAQTYDEGTAERKQLLSDAANAFEPIYIRHRLQSVGLYSRLYQARCFEEQGNLQAAMGIYNELLSQEGEADWLQPLKRKAFLFRLVCLNRRQPPDSQLVIDESEQWLKENKAYTRTLDGLGIQWELARAYDAVGDTRKETDAADAERNWRQARNYSTIVARFPSEYKEPALSLTQRIEVKVGGKERVPDKFDTASGLARIRFDKALEIRKQLDADIAANKSPDELRKTQTDFQNELVDAARLFELSLSLATSQDDPKSVNTARFLLSYTNFYLKKNYEAAILASFVARTVGKDDGALGLDAAFLALAAVTQAYNDAGANSPDRDGDIQLVINAANLVTSRWPSSDRANDARMSLGRLYSQMKRPADAAKWFSEVPETDPKFPEAQMAAGQAYWSAYLSSARLPADVRPSPEQLAGFQSQAQSFLQNGIQRASAALPAEAPGTPELLAAKVSLAAISISQGKDADAITLLQNDPQSVLKGVAIADEAARPAKGVQSRLFASEAYKLLMRAQIGVGQTDAARQTMQALEKIVGSGTDGGADLLELYVGLGRLLREELNRFQAAGEKERFNSLMTSFETFMGDVSQRKDGQSFGSLSWIAETYFALGEVSADDPSRAANFFEKANTALQSILSLAESQPGFASPDQLYAAKVRLVRCHRARHDFKAGEKLLAEVLGIRANDLKTQIEAAEFYRDWGVFDDSVKPLQQSLKGNSALKVWGYATLTQRLQANLARSQKPELRDAFFEVRRKASDARLQLALVETDAAKKKQAFEAARMDVQGTTIILPQMTDEEYAQLNDLYRKILKEEGVPASDLPRTPTTPVFNAEEPASEPEATAKTAKAKAKTEKPKAAKSPAEEDSSWLLWASLLGLGAVGAGGWFAWNFLLAKKEHTPRLKGLREESSLDDFKMPTDAPPMKKPAARPTRAPGVPAAVAGAAVPGAAATPAAAPRPKRTVAPGAAPAARPEGARPEAARPEGARPEGAPRRPRPEGGRPPGAQ